jgi:PAS domain S-box-containing protein
MSGSHNYILVVASYLIAVGASFASLEVASRLVAAVNRGAAAAWLVSGAVAMGLGIWSMHFVAMLGFSLPIPVAFEMSTTGLSILPALAASGAAFWLVRRGQLRGWRLWLAALVFGSGIAGMHYAGMAALAIAPAIRYDWPVVAGSVLVAAAVAYVALRLAFSLSRDASHLRKVLAALVMAAGICAMHYTGMAAAQFAPGSVCTAPLAAQSNGWLGALVGVATVLVLLLISIVAIVDARLSDVNARLAAELTERSRRSEQLAQALRLSEQQFRNAFEFTPIGMGMVDTNGRWIRANRALLHIVGYDEPELYARTFQEMTHPDDLTQDLELTRRLLAGELQSFQIEKRYRHKQGHFVWVDLSVSLVRDHDGTPLRYVAQVQDIVARKAAELQAERSRAFLDGVIDAVPALLIVKDAAHRWVLVNRTFCRAMGQPREALIGRTDFDFLSEPMSRASWDEDDQAMRADAPVTSERSMAMPDGSMVWYLKCKQRFVMEDGGTYVVGIAWDITALKRAQQALHESEERFRSLTALSADWFWEQDEEYRFKEQSYTPRLAAAGISAESMHGKRRWELPFDNMTEADWARHRAVLDARQPFHDLELCRINDAGQRVYISASGEPVFGEDGRFTGYRGVGRDITEQVRARNQLQAHRDELQRLVDERTRDLRRAKEAAEAADSAKSRFLANISHELRTPMHALLSFAQLGSEKAGVGAPYEKLAGYFDKIARSGERLMMLLNDLLDLAKLDADKVVLHKRPTDLRGVVQDAVDELAEMARSKDVTVTVEAPGVPLVAMCDPYRVGQVMRNLLSNAVKFTGEGRCVKVRLDTDGLARGSASMLAVAVSDEGVGIPPAEVEAIFDPFIQSSKTRSNAGGTGLGLAICRQLVELHGGRIWAANRAEGGATVCFTVPAAPAAAAAA